MFKDYVEPYLPPPPPPPRPHLDLDNRPNGQPGPGLEPEAASGDDLSAGERADTLSQDHHIAEESGK